MQEQVKSKKNSACIWLKTRVPFAVVALFFVFESFAYNIQYGDWEKFYYFADKYSFIYFIFNLNNGRIIVDAIPNYLLSHHLLIWSIITFLMVVLLLNSTSVILKIKGNLNFNIIISLGFLLFFPFTLFTGAGPFAVITDYVFPLALIIYGLTIFVECGQSIPKRVLKLIAIFYATNHEQIAIFALLLFLGLLFINLKYKKFRFLDIILSLILTTTELLILLLNPRVANRQKMDVEMWFPNFNQLRFSQKLDIAFVDTLKRFFVSPFVILVAILILVLILSIKKKSFIGGGIASFQLIVLLFPQSTDFIPRVSNTLSNWGILTWGPQLYKGLPTQTSFHSMDSMFPDVYFLGMSLLFIIALVSVLDTTSERLGILYILISGFATRMMLLFAATIYASFDRTFVPFLYALFIVFLYLFIKMMGKDLVIRIDKK